MQSNSPASPLGISSGPAPGKQSAAVARGKAASPGCASAPPA